jgi:hypothetical protein
MLGNRKRSNKKQQEAATAISTCMDEMRTRNRRCEKPRLAQNLPRDVERDRREKREEREI